MAEHAPIPEPRILIDVEADPLTVDRIETLEARIKERPTQFLNLMASLGQVAVGEFQPQGTPVDADDLAVVRQYYKIRADRYASFDEETTQGLKADSRFVQLRQAHFRASESPRRKDGPNPLQEAARDQLRFYQLEYFIGRVVAWQEAQAETSGSESDPKVDVEALPAFPHPHESSENNESLRTAI